MFRTLVSQPVWFITVIVIMCSLMSLVLVRFALKLLTHQKKPLSISSPLPGLAATTFVFIAALLAAQIQGDIGKARQAMYREAGALHMLLLHSEVLPPQQQTQLKQRLQEYVKLVVSDEWLEMQKSGESSAVRAQISTLMRTIYAFNHKDAQDSLRTAANELISARMDRLQIAADTVPPVTWIILGSLALLTLLTLVMNHGEHHQWQRVVSVTASILVSLIFIMLLVHDQPYARKDIVNPQSLLNAVR